VYLERGEHSRALALFEEMEGIGKTIGHRRIEHVGRVSRASAYFLAGDVDRAEELLQGGPEFFRSAGMTGPLGWSLRLAGRIRAARGDLIGSLRHEADADAVAGTADPYAQPLTIAQVEQFAAMLERTQENPAELLEQARRHAADEPSSAEAQAALGDALVRAGSPEEAVDAYRRALTLQPSPEVQVKLADLILSKEFNK
jgi:tetratricopeptide (TPR) repeat protein